MKELAAFKDYMTKDGQALITKMLAGQCKIQFTRLVFGDGYLPAGIDPRNMTELVSPKYETIAVAGQSGQVVTVAGTFTNKHLTYATYLREKGVYATDGDKEVLVIYANNGNEAEYIQPSDTALIEKVIRSVLQFGQDDIVSIEVASGIYVTVENYQQDKIIMENTITERFEQVNTVIQEMKEYECKIAPRYVTDIGVESGDRFVTLTWTDPGETFVDGVKIALWDGTKVVINDEHYPENVDDGTLLLDNTERNKYQTEGFKVENMENLKNYYIRFFPYCVCGGVNDYSEENKVKAVAGLLPVDGVSDIAISQNGTSINITWTDPEETKMYGTTPIRWVKTVLVYKEGSYPENMADGTVVESTVHDQYKDTGLEIAGLEIDKTYYFRFFTISDKDAVNADETQEIQFSLEYATLTVNFSDDDLAEGTITVTATYEGGEVSGVVGSLGFVQLKIPYIGEVAVVASRGEDEKRTTVTIQEYTPYSISIEFLKIVTWADGTWEEINAMVEAHYSGKIDITDYWSIGDTKSLHIGSMVAVGEVSAQSAQDIELQIIDFNHDDLADGSGKSAVTLSMKDCLSATSIHRTDYINITYARYSISNMKKFIDGSFFNALPPELQSIIKPVKKKSVYPKDTSSTNAIDETTEKCFLFSNAELFGVPYPYQNYVTILDGEQYEYFKTKSNRIKNVASQNGAYSWWTRSGLCFNNDALFIACGSNGSAAHVYVFGAYGLAVGLNL